MINSLKAVNIHNCNFLPNHVTFYVTHFKTNLILNNDIDGNITNIVPAWLCCCAVVLFWLCCCAVVGRAVVGRCAVVCRCAVLAVLWWAFVLGFCAVLAVVVLPCCAVLLAA